MINATTPWNNNLSFYVVVALIHFYVAISWNYQFYQRKFTVERQIFAGMLFWLNLRLTTIAKIGNRVSLIRSYVWLNCPTIKSQKLPNVNQRKFITVNICCSTVNNNIKGNGMVIESELRIDVEPYLDRKINMKLRCTWKILSKSHFVLY